MQPILEDVVQNLDILVDVVLLCIERVKLLDRELVSWCHDVSNIVSCGVYMVKVVSYGYAVKRNGSLIGFTAVSNFSGLDEESLSPVYTKVIFSDGKTLEVRPEVELHKCLKELCPRVRIYRF